jgi:hypothetical protein
MENLPYEVKLEILKKIDSFDVLRDICVTSKSFREICKQNWKILIKQIEPKISYVEMENKHVLYLKEFRSEKDAINYYKRVVKEYNKQLLRELQENDQMSVYYLNTMSAAGIIQFSFGDGSDDTRIHMLCGGLTKTISEKIMNELDYELKNSKNENDYSGSSDDLSDDDSSHDDLSDDD